MKKIIFLLTILLFALSSTAMAQQERSNKKSTKEAEKEAKKAQKIDEVPIGCVIVKDGVIIARGYNKKEKSQDVTSHAEIVAIRKASKKLNNWRLIDCDLYVTLEPCVMCSGAIINSRMRSVYFGAYDPEYGGAGGRIDLFSKA